MSAEQLRQLCDPGRQLPVPLMFHGRNRPKRRRNARGGLRPMVRTRRLFTMMGATASGGAGQPTRIVAECTSRSP